MLQAVLQKGVILPLEPLPPDWEEGTALDVNRAEIPVVAIDVWARTMNELCADNSPDNEAVMIATIEEQRRVSKARKTSRGS